MIELVHIVQMHFGDHLSNAFGALFVVHHAHFHLIENKLEHVQLNIVGRGRAKAGHLKAKLAIELKAS